MFKSGVVGGGGGGGGRIAFHTTIPVTYVSHLTTPGTPGTHPVMTTTLDTRTIGGNTPCCQRATGTGGCAVGGAGTFYDGVRSYLRVQVYKQ